MNTDNPGPGAPTDLTEFTRWVAELRTDMAETLGGTLLRGARPVPVSFGTSVTGSMGLVPTRSPGALVGYSLAPGSGVGFVAVRIRDVAGNLIAAVDLAGSGASGQLHSETAWFGPGGINIPDGGLVIEADDAFEGVVYLRGAD